MSRNFLAAGRLACPIAALILFGGGSMADAQGLNFATGDSNVPIEVFADDGIEWQQEKLTFMARGNARAVRGDVTVFADELQAFYRKLPKGGTEIWRLDAIGHVRIETPGEKAYGEHGVYDVDNAILVLRGGKVRLVTDTDVITANEQLEYWERKKMAVARGDAMAVSDGKKLNADVLVAYFSKNKSGKTAVNRVEAFDNVRIDTGPEKVTSNRGVYNAGNGIVTLTDSVKLTRDGNVLDGCRAKIDLNSGVSKLFGCVDQGGRQVGGVFRSGKKKSIK